MPLFAGNRAEYSGRLTATVERRRVKAWVYATVSSNPQEDSLADQERWAEKAAADNGWSIERRFSEVATGKRGVRSTLTKLLAELKALPESARPDVVMMIRIDRIGRGRVVDGQVALHTIRTLGPRIFTRERGFVELDSAMDELMAAMQLALSRQENEVRREKSLAFHARKRGAGEFGSGPPYGFILVEKRLALYEPEATVIRALFEKRLAGWGYQRLGVWAHANAPAKLRPDGSSKSFGWSTSTITSILRNPRYRGAIVSESAWDAVAQLRGRMIDRPTPRWKWPLRGALRCKCGALLLGEASGHNPPHGRRTRYYVCRRITQHGGRYPHHNAAKLEATFVGILERLKAGKGLSVKRKDPESVADLRAKYGSLAAQRDELERRRTAVWTLAEDEAIPRADVARRLEQLTAESETLQGALNEAARALAQAERREGDRRTVEQLFRDAAAIWGLSDTPTQRTIAMAVAEYYGGFWCDPNEPGKLKVGGSAKKVDTLRNVDMAQRKADDAITKKFIQSITE